MAKIDRRCSAPPENMLTTPRMVFDWSLKKRATASGLIPGTGIKVPMRYTTRPPIRNNRRPRISPKRPASASVAAGFDRAELATSVLDVPAGGRDGFASTLGDLNALERHGLLDLARQHDLGTLSGRRHDTGALERCEIDHCCVHQGELMQTHFGARRLHGGTKSPLRQTTLQWHLAAFKADLVIAAFARALTLDAAAASLALARRGAAADAQPRAARAGPRLAVVQSHVSHVSSTPLSTGARQFGSCRDWPPYRRS